MGDHVGGSDPRTSPSDPDPDPHPDVLLDRYGDAIRNENAVELDAETFESVRSRAARGWGVGALVVREGRALLVEQDGRWFLPGGMLERDETLAEGAVREVREETGIEVEIDGLAAISEQTFVSGDDAFRFHFATFDAAPVTVEPAEDPGLDGEDIRAVEWRETIPADTYDRDLVLALLARDEGL
ncbi:NUDIX domain-containing protein [Halomarina pelagica]|uniref:NUDIX domain-containing protein n=1 Tax=Halomarina pelagica TaxID=2961599 RepID=UPI0020C27B5C|nr:NUDIX domain-containing protein [Halomarina sp. BND7]